MTDRKSFPGVLVNIKHSWNLWVEQDEWEEFIDESGNRRPNASERLDLNYLSGALKTG